MKTQPIDFMCNQAYLDMITESERNKETKAKIASDSVMLLMQDLAAERAAHRQKNQTYHMVKFITILIGFIFVLYFGMKITSFTNKFTTNMMSTSQELMNQSSEQFEYYQDNLNSMIDSNFSVFETNPDVSLNIN